MKIKTKMALGFGFFLFLMVITLGILLNLMGHLNQNMNEMVAERYERVRLANIIQHEVANMNNDLREMLMNPDEPVIERIEQIESNRMRANEAINSLMRIASKSQELVDKVDETLADYIEFEQEIVAMIQKGQIDEAIALIDEANDIRLHLYQMVKELNNFQHDLMLFDLQQSRDTYRLTVFVVISFMTFFLLVGIGVTYLVMRGITKNINNVTNVMAKAASESTSEVFFRVEDISNDEIGEIAKVYNKMVKALEDHVRQEQSFTKAIQEQNWFNENIAAITTSYQGVHDFNSLLQLFVNKITPAVSAGYSVFYLKDINEQNIMKKIAGYAWKHLESRTEKVQVGEGLVGQCALENKTIYLSRVPEDYIKITSGLGEKAPANILLMPVEFEGKVLGVLELASFSSFSQIHLALLRQALTSLGITLNNLTHQYQVKKLLAESQSLTEELQTQSEELQLQQEELENINEKLEEENRNSLIKTNELEKTKEVLEKKANQLLLASRYKSEFLANMSHELRTPLNSLLILAQLLKENNKGNLTPKQVEYANTIYSAGNDLLDLINDILELSKVESGKIEINFEQISLTKLKKQLVQHFSPVAQQQGLEFNINIAQDLPQNICTDLLRLQQILNNLLANAFKFTHEGSVTLRFSRANPAEGQKIRQAIETDLILAIEVIDTGIGIPAHKQTDIFEEFCQGDGTTSRKYGGTGLGLSISKKYAELLGGYIKVTSQEGRGSIFTLILPSLSSKQSYENFLSKMEQELIIGKEIASGISELPGELVELRLEQEELTKPDDQAYSLTTNFGTETIYGDLAGKTVLIVDDDLRNLYALTVSLERQKIKVLAAENGKEGIKKLQENPEIDLVLMDIMMPEMDGYETIKEIRKNLEYKQIPIIALTAKAMKNDKQKCIAAGASDYISKPVNLKQLFSLLQVWMYK